MKKIKISLRKTITSKINPQLFINEILSLAFKHF